MNPAHMVADSISNLHTNNMTMTPTAGLNKEARAIVEKECAELFDEIRDGNLDFITDTLASHAIILNNVMAVCYRKSKNGNHFQGYAELSLKAADQLSKTGLTLAKIKNVIVTIENLTLQQNNLLQLNIGQDKQEPTQEVVYGKTMVTA